MVESAESRRVKRRDLVRVQFHAEDVEAALDLLALVDLAWHDCYGESSPSEAVLYDILTVAGGELRSLSRAGHLAVIDRRDLRLTADERRRTRGA